MVLRKQEDQRQKTEEVLLVLSVLHVMSIKACKDPLLEVAFQINLNHFFCNTFPVFLSFKKIRDEI